MTKIKRDTPSFPIPMTSFEHLLSPLGLASLSQCEPRRTSDAEFPAAASFFFLHSGLRITAPHDRRGVENGGREASKTEYSSLCNRFNLLCRNRLQYFASLLESCISLLPPSLLFSLPSSFPLAFPHHCNMALSISLSVWAARRQRRLVFALHPSARLPGGGI